MMTGEKGKTMGKFRVFKNTESKGSVYTDGWGNALNLTTEKKYLYAVGGSLKTKRWETKEFPTADFFGIIPNTSKFRYYDEFLVYNKKLSHEQCVKYGLDYLGEKEYIIK